MNKLDWARTEVVHRMIANIRGHELKKWALPGSRYDMEDRQLFAVKMELLREPPTPPPCESWPDVSRLGRERIYMPVACDYNDYTRMRALAFARQHLPFMPVAFLVALVERGEI